jgi:hypothetical protein
VTFFEDAGLVEKGGFVFVFTNAFYLNELFGVVRVVRVVFTDSLFDLNVTVVGVRAMRVRTVAVTVGERSYNAVGVVTARPRRARCIRVVVDVGLVLLLDVDLYVLGSVVMSMGEVVMMAVGPVVGEFGFRDTFFGDDCMTVTFPLVLVGELRGRLVMAAELARRRLELRFDFFVDGPR